MKKRIIILMICCVLGLTACNTKAKEEVLAQTTEVFSELGEVSFTLNGYWSLQRGEEIEGMDLREGQTYDMIAKHTETGTNINIIYDDLTKSDGGTLVRMEDYVNAVQESLKTFPNYTYSCSDITTTNLHGKEYQTFSAKVAEVEGTQHFYIRRIEDTIMVMTITLYGEDTLEEVIALSQ